jgi:hypothetical protein
MVLPADLDRIARWTAARWFDVDWRPGLAAPATRFNFLDAPVLFEAARAAVGGEEAASRFAAAYPFDVRPATDARPYPHAFLGRRTLRLMFERGRGDWLPFAEWGYLAVLATLAQGAVLAALLLALPAIFVRSGAGGEHHGRLLWYFGALGLAYLLAEIAAIQQLTLLLGHPVYAVAAGWRCSSGRESAAPGRTGWRRHGRAGWRWGWHWRVARWQWGCCRWYTPWRARDSGHGRSRPRWCWGRWRP